MNLIKDFFDAKEAICKYFGYKQDWVNIPFEDLTEDEWVLTEEKDGSGYVSHGPKINFETLDTGSEIYGSRIYTQRFLPKWVYRGKDYTMISMDTGCDGNKYLGIFTNSKEVKMTKKMAEAQFAHGAF